MNVKTPLISGYTKITKIQIKTSNGEHDACSIPTADDPSTGCLLSLDFITTKVLPYTLSVSEKTMYCYRIKAAKHLCWTQNLVLKEDL